MIARLIQVSEPALNIWIDHNSCPIKFEKRTTNDRAAIMVNHICTTFETARIENDILYIDAMGLINFINWLHQSRQAISSRAIANRLVKYFPKDSHFDAMVAATFRATLDGDTNTYGEDLYYESRAETQIRNAISETDNTHH